MCGIHKCEELDGDLTCKCLNGYKNLSLKICGDIDECESNSSNGCGENVCVNLEGDYRCDCINETHESIYNKICSNRVKNHESGSFILPKVRGAEIIYIKVYIYVVYIGIQLLNTIRRSAWRFLTTERYYSDSDDDSDDVHGDVANHDVDSHRDNNDVVDVRENVESEARDTTAIEMMDEETILPLSAKIRQGLGKICPRSTEKDSAGNLNNDKEVEDGGI